MHKEIVQVVTVDKEKVGVKFQKTAACSCCRLTNLCKNTVEILLVNNPGLNLTAGDKVILGIDQRKTFLAYLIIFLIPIGIFLSSLIALRSRGEVVSFFLALLGVCIYYVITKLALRKHEKKFSLKILEKL